ncbi:hypothetical protein RISW2_17440 [Roseivivax isoporae LMG 25204]|uniref:Integral membrane protein n=2 Tax=Roseivivax TaxID=93682 RepID=X7F4F1_9RHOB|nr:hypothetical protein RISW2_17440 [Roseivivax isoporae LMG 25204]
MAATIPPLAASCKSRDKLGPMTHAARMSAALLALAAIATLVWHVQLGLDRNPGRTLAVELWRTGRYFTILTVALTGALFAAAALRGRMAAGMAGGLALWMAVVGIVYHVLLARELSGARLVVDQMMHTVLPIAVALWWVACADKAGLAARHALWWLAWPGLYCAYALGRGALDGRHPYFFLDPARIGWPQVALWIVALGGVFWIGGLGLVALARRIGRRS